MENEEVLNKSYMAVCDQKQALIAEVEHLRKLVAEIVPYLITEVKVGLSIGPFSDCPDQECEDCRWYAECCVWAERINAGELGPYRV